MDNLQIIVAGVDSLLDRSMMQSIVDVPFADPTQRFFELDDRGCGPNQ